MTARTRYFVVVSLLILAVGLGTGLVAYYVGFPAGAFARRGGPDELQYVPRDATVVAFADVHHIMTSELRQKVHAALPMKEDGQRELEERTGINIEYDVDRVVACVTPADREGGPIPGAGMVLARGRFNEVKIEALMREHGARVEDYQGTRLIVADMPTANAKSFAVAFLEPGLVALGSTSVIHTAVDLHKPHDKSQPALPNVTDNEELMNQVRALDSGNAWAVGRFDALQAQAHLPPEVATRLPPITWFSASGHIDGGIRAELRAEARDDEAGNNLREVVRGFMALAKLQAGNRPEFQAVMQSLELSGTGKTVALAFAIPPQVFDAIGAMQHRPGADHGVDRDNPNPGR